MNDIKNHKSINSIYNQLKNVNISPGNAISEIKKNKIEVKENKNENKEKKNQIRDEGGGTAELLKKLENIDNTIIKRNKKFFKKLSMASFDKTEDKKEEKDKEQKKEEKKKDNKEEEEEKEEEKEEKKEEKKEKEEEKKANYKI